MNGPIEHSVMMLPELLIAAAIVSLLELLHVDDGPATIENAKFLPDDMFPAVACAETFTYVVAVYGPVSGSKTLM